MCISFIDSVAKLALLLGIIRRGNAAEGNNVLFCQSKERSKEKLYEDCEKDANLNNQRD